MLHHKNHSGVKTYRVAETRTTTPTEKGNEEKCKSHAHKVADYARRFPRGHWSFLGLGSEKKWYGSYPDKSDGVWHTTAEDMMLEFAETIHAVFRASSVLEGGELRSKGGKKTLHFNGSKQNVELILRTVMSANLTEQSNIKILLKNSTKRKD